MSSYMHIVSTLRADLDRLGLATPKSLCGKKLRSGPDRDAPLCPKCYRLSGWTHDKRKN